MQRLVLSILLLSLAASLAWAKGDNELYAVHGIAVDATADNASAARDKAIAEGARKGLEQLLLTLSGGTDPKSIPMVTDKTASSLVQDFDVESERASGTRYIAKLGFHFRPDGVRAMLAGSGAKFVSARAPLTLIIPVYRAATGDLLWQPDNTWRAAWKDAASHAGLVPVVVPDGGSDDQQMLTAADLQDAGKLDALGQKYKADAEAVVIASAASQTGDPSQGLQLSFIGAGKGTDTFHSDGTASPGDTLAKGVAASLAELDLQWRNHALKGSAGPILFKTETAAAVETATATGTPSGNQYAIQAQFNGPGDWPALRTRLSQIPGIQRIQLKSLSRDGAVIVLAIAGDDNQLTQTLAQGGITLGSAQAVPAGDSEVSAMVPSSGPGAGLIYPVTGSVSAQ